MGEFLLFKTGALKRLKNLNNYQYRFITKIGSGLNRENIVFTIFELVNEFFTRYPFFKCEDKKFGKSKKFSHEELLGFIILCYFKEIRSYRKMSIRAKNNDEDALFILGTNTISKSMISNFMNQKGFLFTEFLYFTVKKGIELNMITNEILSLDGTFINAYANKNRRISRDEIKFLKKILQKIDFNNTENKLHKNLKKYFNNPIEENKLKQVDNVLNNLNSFGIKLLKEGLISNKSRNNIITYLDEITGFHGSNTNFDINLTDPESTFLPDKKGVKSYNYNFQVVTDSKNDMIVATSLVNDSNDINQLIPMIESSIMVLDEKPKFMVVDNGYYTYEALCYCIINNITLIIPDKAEASRKKHNKNKNKYKKSNFIYDRINDTYTCVHGVKLEFKNIRGQGIKKSRVYTSDKCKKCKYLKECCKTNKREIIERSNPIIDYFKDIYYSDKGQEIYKKRANLSETIYAHLKEARNFNGLKRKGVEKCLIVLNIEAIVHNIGKIHREKFSKNENEKPKKYEQITLKMQKI